MATQLITVLPNGGVVGLEHKNGGIDLKQFGEAVVTRVTEIEWDTKRAGWYIRWSAYTKSHLKRWTVEEVRHSKSAKHLGVIIPEDDSIVVLFKSYLHAVTVEIEVIQHLQKEGLL